MTVMFPTLMLVRAIFMDGISWRGRGFGVDVKRGRTLRRVTGRYLRRVFSCSEAITYKK